jgi:hypothetical protein
MEESLNRVLAWFAVHPVAAGALLVWVLIWKGLALWKAAGLRQKYWFIAMLVLNTLGLLEIFYICFVASKYKLEVIDDKS